MYRNAFLSGLLTLFLAGCATPPDETTGLPEELPRSNLTQYSEMLSCLGGLIEAANGPEIDILVSGLRDGTRPPTAIEPGFLTYGGEFMARTSLSHLAPRVGVIAPTAIDPKRATIALLGEFTELDRVSPSSGWAGSLRIAGLELELDIDRTWDIMALDLELTLPNGRQVPGLATSLAAVIDTRTSDGHILIANEDGKFAASGAGKFKSVGRRHSTQRLLIEMGIFTLLSRFFEIDPAPCLGKLETSVEGTRVAIKAYGDLSDEERVMAIQRALKQRGYEVPLTGQLDRHTHLAISRFQLSNGEPPTGQVSASLYARLHKTSLPLETAEPHAQALVLGRVCKV